MQRKGTEGAGRNGGEGGPEVFHTYFVGRGKKRKIRRAIVDYCYYYYYSLLLTRRDKTKVAIT